MEIIAIFIATCIMFFVSEIYFSPRVFGKNWQKSLGIKEKNKGLPKTFLSFLLCFIEICIIAFFLEILSVDSLVSVYITVLLLWLFLSTSKLIETLRSEKKIYCYFLETQSDLLGLLLGASALYIW